MGQQPQEVGSYEGPFPQLPEAISVGGSAGIAAKLRRAIIDGVYGLNERLPAERDLADLFKTSRGTIREALRKGAVESASRMAKVYALTPVAG